MRLAKRQRHKLELTSPVWNSSRSSALNHLVDSSFEFYRALLLSKPLGTVATASHFELKPTRSQSFCPNATHWYPEDEHVTVIVGEFALGFGERFSLDLLRRLAAGSHALIPSRQPHFTRYTAGTVVQVHGIGPLVINDLEGCRAHSGFQGIRILRRFFVSAAKKLRLLPATVVVSVFAERFREHVPALLFAPSLSLGARGVRPCPLKFRVTARCATSKHTCFRN